MYLCDVPLHPVGYHPSFPERTPISVGYGMLRLIEDCRVTGTVVPSTSSANDHIAF